MRLIDAEELKKLFPDKGEGSWTYNIIAKSYIDNAPTVEERPKGGWAKTCQSFINPNKFRNFCCSNCFFELDEHIRVEPNFCPNCGSDNRSEV